MAAGGRARVVIVGAVVGVVLGACSGGSHAATSSSVHLTASQVAARLRPIGCISHSQYVDDNNPPVKPTATLACTIHGHDVLITGYANMSDMRKELVEFKTQDCRVVHKMDHGPEAAAYGNAWAVGTLSTALAHRMASLLHGQYARVC